MRPVEAVAPEMFKDMSDSRVESVGPLAGLRGTLPAELDIKDTLKPPPYSLKLAVPDDQQARLDVLKSLLEAETQATPVSSQVVFSPQILLRLVVFAGFLVAVIWALWAGPLPSTQLSIAQAPQQILDFQDQG